MHACFFYLSVCLCFCFSGTDVVVERERLVVFEILPANACVCWGGDREEWGKLRWFFVVFFSFCYCWQYKLLSQIYIPYSSWF